MQGAHLGIALVGVFHGMVRMHAGGGEQETGMRLGQRQRLRRMLAAGAGDHHLHHAGVARALQHRVAVVVEAVVGEVGADVDQFHAHSLSRNPVGAAAAASDAIAVPIRCGDRGRGLARAPAGQTLYPCAMSARLDIPHHAAAAARSGAACPRIRAWCWKRRPARARPRRCRWRCWMSRGWRAAGS